MNVPRRGLPVFDNPLSAEQLDPPALAPWRLFELDGATARIFAKSRWRVTLLVSSGWSHAFLTAKNHYPYPDTAADRELFEALRDGEHER